MTITRAFRDPNLLALYLGKNRASFRSWTGGVLPAIFGERVDPRCHDLVEKSTHRTIGNLPKSGFKRSLILCGRRSGKSKIAGAIAAYLAAMSGLESQCSAGEVPYVACLAPTRQQADVVFSYAAAALSSPVLSTDIVDKNKDQITLSNGVVIKKFAGSFRSARGFSIIGAVVDEINYFRHSEECELTAKELMTALGPSLLTIKGAKLVAIGSKYSMEGYGYETWKAGWESGDANAYPTLIWDAQTTTMNPTISQDVIDQEIAADPVGARSEYLNLWREDVSAFLPRSVIEACVARNRVELVPRSHLTYKSFVDMSGGVSDDAACAIAHRETGGKVVIDKLLRYKPPFDPYEVIASMATEMKEYGINRCSGDRYGAEYTLRAFRNNGIAYIPSEKNKSELYIEAIPLLCSAMIELPDNPLLVNQFAALERRARSGGRDIVDHPKGNGHDDLSNCVAGVAYQFGKPTIRVGGFSVLETQRLAAPQYQVSLARARLARLVTSAPTIRRSFI